MQRKLQCILVDDDPLIYDIFKDYLKDNEYAEIIDYFQDPREFIKSQKKADIVFIDIMMPEIDGFTLAHLIKPTPVILFTGNQDRFKDILNEIEVIDAFAKPFSKDRLMDSVKKACRAITPQKNGNKLKKPKHAEFNTLGSKEKIRLTIRNIVHIETHGNPRNKVVSMADGTEHVFMDYSMKEIRKIASHLLQPNHSELVAEEIVTAHGYDHIYIKLPNREDKKMVIIGYHFSKEFKKRLREF